MNINIDTYKVKNLLKFLFPEYQIIESIKKYGFFVKETSTTDVKANPQNLPPVNNLPNSAPVKNPPPKLNATATTVSEKSKTPKKTNIKFTEKELNKKMAKVKTVVSNIFVGQPQAVEDLLIAFKRPFITGANDEKPKNTIFVVGSEGTGKHTLVKTAVTVLHQEQLLNTYELVQFDLSLYSAISDKDLFISDLSQILNTNFEVIVFEQFENCHASILEIISKIVVDGRYQLGAIDKISANNKFFIFITKSSENKIADTFGNRFMGCIEDIVNFSQYSDKEITEITRIFLRTLVTRCQNNLSLTIVSSNDFVLRCAAKYKKTVGFGKIEEYLLRDIYKVLTECKLRGVFEKVAAVKIDFIGERLTAIVVQGGDTSQVDLTPFMPKKNAGNLDEVKKELASIVGLTKVKEFVLSLENNLKVQQMREEAGFKAASLALNMIFIGNPGTGKTTIARIIAKYLKTVGVLSVGQLREVTRADLVGQYLGHTAKQTNEIIQSALGGVLFIDEAYSLCRDKHDSFGLEAIDALVKAIEDYRDDLVVILAGYQDEMMEFLKVNSGLKSRFPNIINFTDYSVSEMVAIADITAKSKGYKIAGNCQEPLERLFEKSQIKGRNDSGNGRLVRNIIENAILEQAKRIIMAKDSAMDLLEYQDFKFENFENFDLEKSLEGIIGLGSIKDFIRMQHKLLIANEKRKKAGIKVDSSQSLNMVFTGNPGTGKTTIARVAASMFKSMGLLVNATY